jgi:hypothetical protein
VRALESIALSLEQMPAAQQYRARISSQNRRAG